jgi:hypothetical protein
MALTAAETETGKIYRRTRNSYPGTYYKRPNLSVAKFIARLRRRANPLCREVFMLQQHRSHPDLVLLSRYNRGTDPLTGDRYEYQAYVFVQPEMMLREVAKPPGYRRPAKGNDR